MTSSHADQVGRPELYTSYAQDMALLEHHAEEGVRRRAAGARRWRMTVLGRRRRCCSCWPPDASLAIGAIGLNIVTGYAGQVSLGHAFFLAIGAYTAAVLSGDPDGRVLGFGITEVPVWLLAAGALSAAWPALLVAPLAVRLRGLYLAIVTLGLVFIGQYVFRRVDAMTGGPAGHRSARRRCQRCSAPVSMSTAPSTDPRPAAVPADAGAAGDLRPARPQPRPVAHRPGLRRHPRPGHRRRR